MPCKGSHLSTYTAPPDVLFYATMVRGLATSIHRLWWACDPGMNAMNNDMNFGVGVKIDVGKTD